MSHISTILWKEWLELRQQRLLVLTILLVPLFLSILPLIVAGVVTRAPQPPRNSGLPPAALDNPALIGFSNTEMLQAVLGQQFSLLFLLLPVIIPGVVAAHSIVGEKTSRTLEPLLAAPVRTWELLVAKSLAALIPAVVITAFCTVLFIVGMSALAVSPRVLPAIISPGWAIVIVFCTPLLALVSIAAIMVVSARVNDPRTAQQVASVAVVPVFVLFIGNLAGALTLSPSLALVAAAVLAVIAALSMWAAVRLFQRERILTRLT